MDNSLIYWAQPIDFATNAEIYEHSLDHYEYLDKLKTFLIGSGWSVYSPMDAFYVGGNPAPFVANINNHALRQSGALIAALPANVATYGVPSEIEQAISQGKPVLIVTDLNGSYTVAGWNSHPNVRVVDFGHDPQDLATSLTWRTAGSEGGAPLVFAKMADEAILPTRGHDDDAGFDLYTLEDTVIMPGEFADVPTGVAVDLPDGLWGMITGRSSTLRKRKLLVTTGIIDNGYTGALFAGCQNLSTRPVTVLAGERVAQIILLPTSALGLNAQWGTTRNKARGAAGFGSTGV